MISELGLLEPFNGYAFFKPNADEVLKNILDIGDINCL